MFPKADSSFTFKETTPGEILDVIKTTSSSLDGIPRLLIKEVPPIICNTLTVTFNRSIECRA